jgi:hypothetical protein
MHLLICIYTPYVNLSLRQLYQLTWCYTVLVFLNQYWFWRNEVKVFILLKWHPEGWWSINLKTSMTYSKENCIFWKTVDLSWLWHVLKVGHCGWRKKVSSFRKKCASTWYYILGIRGLRKIQVSWLHLLRWMAILSTAD